MNNGPGVADVLYRFGAFAADPLTGRLYHGSEAVPLTPKCFKVLMVLVTSGGQRVDKEDLFKLVWPDTFVEQNNLARSVSMIRKALHECDGEREYILTVPGRGYQLVQPVRELPRSALTAGAPVDNPDDAPAETPAESDPTAAASTPAVQHSHVSGSRAWWAITAAAAAVLLFAGSAMVVLLREGDGDVQSSSAARRLWQLTSSGRLAGEPAWSPDGRSVAYSADSDGNFDIWVQPLAAASPIRVTDSPARDWQPAWSPDGRQIAFRSERDGGGLFVVAPEGGTPRRVSDFGDEPQWSPDGSRILFTGAGGCYLVFPGSQPVAVLQDVIPRIAGRFHTAWHPDGRRISVSGYSRTSGWTFWTAPAEGGPAVESRPSPGVADAMRASGLALGRFSWSPSGDALYFEGQAGQTANLWRIEVDGATLNWVAGPERLTTASTIDTRPAPSPDGTRLAFGSRIERTSAWSLPFDPTAGRVLGQGERVTPEGANTEILDMSPDGRRLAYRVNARDRQELWMRSLEGGADRLRASETTAAIVQPRWSRDGTQLAYIRRPIDSVRSPAVVLLGPEEEDERVLRATPAPEMIYDWSGDGRSLLVRCRTSSINFAICVLPGTAGSDRAANMRVVAAAEGRNLYAAKFSPDERWISFIATTSVSRSTVFVSPAAGGAWIPITDERYFEDKPRWSPDGRTLYFLSNRNGFWNLWGRRFDSPGGKPVGEPFQVTAFDSSVHMIRNDVANLQIAVTRERLILPITEASGAIWVLEGVGE